MMRRLLPTLLLLTNFSAHAQDTSDESLHNALRQVKTTMAKALNERDFDTIAANVTDDVVFTTMNGDVCRGKEQIRAYFDKMLNAPGHIVKDIRVSFEADALTQLYGGDTGIAYGSSRDHYELTNGQVFDINGRWTCTLVQQGDRWRIASFHYSANIFRNPILDKMKQFFIGIAIAAAVAGIIAGFVLAKIAGRKKVV